MEAIQNFFSFPTSHYNYLRDTFDLLTLVNQSYQALDIGHFYHISELQSAIEDVNSVKKRVLEKKWPSDIESLGLAASFSSTEEVDTFERMVSFFHKKKPASGIPWEIFTIEDGQLLMKEEAYQDKNRASKSEC